jgi:hypothetical protein
VIVVSGAEQAAANTSARRMRRILSFSGGGVAIEATCC